MIDYKTISLANQVYERIESNILNGVYEKGEIISESKLSEELGVSRTPIREALARLQNDLLIGDSPAGTVVLGITGKDVEDMFVVKRRTGSNRNRDGCAKHQRQRYRKRSVMFLTSRSFMQVRTMQIRSEI